MLQTQCMQCCQMAAAVQRCRLQSKGSMCAAYDEAVQGHASWHQRIQQLLQGLQLEPGPVSRGNA